MHAHQKLSIRRLAQAFAEPRASVGRWVAVPVMAEPSRRPCPVSGDPKLRATVRSLCDEPRHRTFGYRRIWAVLKFRERIGVNKKTVLRIMREEKLTRPKFWHRPARPKRVRKMRPTAANRGWQIDMTSLVLSDLTPVYLVMVTDTFTRQLVGYTLDRRCRAGEWTAAVRTALESRGLTSKEACRKLTLRSDNGSQPCSKAFVEYLGKTGVQGEYTGYNAPDDNAYIERVFRTIKEEEIWPNQYDTLGEAREAIEAYVNYYNQERVHSSLGYRTPNAYAAANTTLTAA